MITWLRQTTIDIWKCGCGKIIVSQAQPKRCRACGKSASGKPVGRPRLLPSSADLDKHVAEQQIAEATEINDYGAINRTLKKIQAKA
jgi:hypothetical protein